MAKQRIVELSDVSADQVYSFFERRNIAPDVVRWKYFSDGFSRGRPRGFVTVASGEVIAFIGLIPFELATAENRIPSAWTCDWYVDEEKASSFLGITLLRHAISSVGILFHEGGNPTTKAIFGKLADFVEADGVSHFRLNLRLGAKLRRLSGNAMRSCPRIAEYRYLSASYVFGTVQKSPPEGRLTVSVASKIQHRFLRQHFARPLLSR